MTEASDHDLLVTIHAKIENMEKQLNVAASEQGFPRCATIRERLRGLESALKWGSGLVLALVAWMLQRTLIHP